jgi:hypothetical protein
MARRRDGRELFEIFRETKSGPQEPAGEEISQAAAARREPGREAEHVIRLGDRRDVEFVLSKNWICWIAFFLFSLLLIAFLFGRRMAPEAPEPVSTVEAPESFREDAAPVMSGAGSIAVEEEGEADSAGVEETPGAPEPIRARGQLTILVATYRNRADQRERAEEFMEWFRKNGFPDAKLVTSQSGKWIYAITGSYETTDRGSEDMRTIKSLKYRNSSFGGATFKNVNGL